MQSNMAARLEFDDQLEKNMTSRYGNALKVAKKTFNIRIIGEAANQEADFSWVVCELTIRSVMALL